ncbi:hypothetical protein KJ885_03020 [Patescibacteria group bacterium]|nr:hypothetical protein [Patescibacteria group bacterium]
MENTGPIIVDRANSFCPARLFKNDDYNIYEQDERSIGLVKIAPANIRLVDVLAKNEERIKGEERLSRLKQADHIRLDANVLLTLWKNQHLVPDDWKKKGRIFFDGTILRDSRGCRSVLYLRWFSVTWDWRYHSLKSRWDNGYPSAVLPSELAL